MNTNRILVLVGLTLLTFLTAQASETTDLKLPKIQVVPIKDTQEDRQYELYIKLPENYAKNKDKTFPVIYYTDAEVHVETISAATEFLMEEAILVGISWQKDIGEDFMEEHGAQVSRYRDFSMRKSSNPEDQAVYQFGQASNHIDFIRNDVIKTVEKNYQADPDNRTYFGYSMGGSFGAYILMRKPDTFKNYILGSPDLEGDIPLLSKTKSNAALKGKGLNANIFLSYGSLEKELGKYAEDFITLLKNRNDKSLSIKRMVIEGSHQTAFPMTGVRSVTWLANLKRD